MRRGRRQQALGLGLIGLGLILSGGVLYGGLKKELFVLTFGIAFFGLLLLIAGRMQQQKLANGFVQIMNDLQDMPATMQQLAWVQFFSWFALFAMWIYTTAGVTAHIYGTSDTTSALYNEGADWVGICFAVYNGVAAIIAFFLPPIAKTMGRKATHALCLAMGALGLASIYLVTEPMWLLVSMVGIGIAWASILSMPYAILTGALPANKMGYYMGVFNFFIVIPQILAASILGFLVSSLFSGQAIYALFLGAVSFLIAAALTFRVEDKDGKG